MKISIHWIKELFPALDASADEIVDKLSSSGFEVEARENLADALEGVVVADVKFLEKHPSADNLRVAKVFDGEGEKIVVCGAPNVEVGQKVAFARLGAKLPNGMSIERRTIRGVESEGMICSESELGLSDASEGIIVLESRVRPGKAVASVLGVNDVLLEVGVTPNRPDALSHYGLARELAALFDVKLKSKKISPHEGKSSAKSRVKIEINDKARCTRYVGRVITGVRVGPSPDWVVRRLRVLGQRSISNVVDATNLALLERGHPLHAFDLAKLEGEKIIVRRANEGEKLTTIDAVERTLSEDDLVIADATKPVALAGIMGGQDSGVTAETVDVLLESAYFDPGSVRRSGRRHGLHTEASHRFERGADPEALESAIDRTAELILELAGGALSKGYVVAKGKNVESPIAPIRPKRAALLLGRPVDTKEIKNTMARLGLEPVAAKAGATAVRKLKRKTKPHLHGALFFRAPSWRVDISREEDLIEELARLDGYDNIPTLMPPMNGSVWTEAPKLDAERTVRHTLADLGFLEAISLAFNSRAQLEAFGVDAKDAVEVANPLGEESALMRVSLMPALLKAVRHNQDVLPSITDLRLFEIGNVFSWDRSEKSVSVYEKAERLPVERLDLALLMRGQRFPSSWAAKDERGQIAKLDAFDLKAMVQRTLETFRILDATHEPAETTWLHPKSRTRIVLQGETLGFYGELHPDVMARFGLEGAPVFVAELRLAHLERSAGGHAVFTALPRQPPARRDLSFFVAKTVPAAKVLETIRGASVGKNLESVELFDVYEGKDESEKRRSLAVAMTFRAAERTLTDAEVEGAQAAIVSALAALGAEVRMA